MMNMNEIVQQFLGSNIATQATQTLTKDHGLNPQDAKNAVKATAEGSAEVIGKGGFDFAAILKSLGGMAGALGGTQPAGLPPALVRSVTDIVVSKTGLSPAIASTVVSMVLPKVLEYAKGLSPVV